MGGIPATEQVAMQRLLRHVLGIKSNSQKRLFLERFPEDFERQKGLRAVIGTMLEGLHPLERKIVELRYGFGDGHQYDRTRVSDILNLSINRIIHFEEKVIRKLQQAVRLEQLEIFLNK